ncbi:hypothetical protein AVEN_101082-1 [Araneus ventricosus]|uniref:Uncharacterized protein n=1 Tax=Araneus ventricosus TaxID=182803 RepID=A0A4Y2EAV9_ARAVE|nr:hypothetical protein AVEN_101082-1 [Araneus ventricosus]
MEVIRCNSYLEGEVGCQYSADELMENNSGEKPTPATIRQKIKEKYGGRIVFSRVRTRKTVVCFRGATEKILLQSRVMKKQSEKESFEPLF